MVLTAIFNHFGRKIVRFIQYLNRPDTTHGCPCDLVSNIEFSPSQNHLWWNSDRCGRRWPEKLLLVNYNFWNDWFWLRGLESDHPINFDSCQNNSTPRLRVMLPGTDSKTQQVQSWPSSGEKLLLIEHNFRILKLEMSEPTQPTADGRFEGLIHMTSNLYQDTIIRVCSPFSKPFL